MNQELPWVRKPGVPVMKETRAGEVRYLQFPLLLKWQDVAVHGFSTRLGGASRGVYASMNFSFSRGDDPDCVRENYRRMGEALGVDPGGMVLWY